MHKILVKANNELVSWCKCTEAAYATECQLDCPWCGCGWLFSCITCRCAFTFAKVVDSKLSALQLMLQDRSSYYKKPVALDDDEVISKAEWLEKELEPLVLGTVCAFLDGKVLAMDNTNIGFDGWYARHTFSAVPQWSVHGSVADIKALVGNKTYWLNRELKDTDTQ